MYHLYLPAKACYSSCWAFYVWVVIGLASLYYLWTLFKLFFNPNIKMLDLSPKKSQWFFEALSINIACEKS